MSHLKEKRMPLHLIERGQDPVQFGMHDRGVGVRGQSQVASKLRESVRRLVCVIINAQRIQNGSGRTISVQGLTIQNATCKLSSFTWS